jgi:class 3 adenylate cyclase/YHS domain-containing protein
MIGSPGVQPADSDEQTSTFIFADLAGFTALTEAHGDEQAADLAAEFSDTVRQLLPEYVAEEVKTIGDAIMLRCEEARAAIDLGLRIVDEVGARPQFPIVRVGMHTGPAIERGGDWFGAAVNLAARVSGVAGGDEVLLTEATRQAAGRLEGIQLHQRGKQRFKNIKEPIAVYRAVRGGQEREGLPIDPVCRMAVDPGKAAGNLTYEGREYHFCSMECVQAFVAAPHDYAGSG